MSVLSQPAYFAHANVFHHEGKPVPIELSIATIPRDGSDPEIMCITVNHAGQPSNSKDVRSNCQENARLRLVHHQLPKSVPVEYLPFCVRGKFSQLARGNRGLMVVKGLEQQKMFQELGLYAMALENLPKFKDICDGTFPDPVHEGVHEEEDIFTINLEILPHFRDLNDRTLPDHLHDDVHKALTFPSAPW
ncbi:hypothetical protein TNCV_3285911 [Trichonephila clavipes]|nr:hypothetical protein TNCV_3285911 [Trichonephila clavipes]